MRAALVAASDDPVILGFWLRNFAATVGPDVDALHLAINGPHADDVAQGLVTPTGYALVVQTYPERRDHGWCLRRLYDANGAEALLFLETDAWFRRDHVAAGWFATIESGRVDAIGSPRHPASPQLIAAAERRWGILSAGEDQGTALWPCFLTASRAAIDGTDRHFGARAYPARTLVPGLGMFFPEATTDETFVGVSWQLRDAKARIRLVPQHRVARGTLCRPEGSAWFHAGSLSVAFGMAWGEVENEGTLRGVPEDEMARRCALWDIIADLSPRSDRRIVFAATLAGMVARLGIGADLIEGWRAYYAPWFQRLDDPTRSIADGA